MNPPIRSEEDRLALIEGLLDGTIDCIATDHAPHSLEEKSKGLRDSAMGIVGLETAFPVLYTKLVKSGVLELGQLISLISINPRRVFGIDSGFFEAASEFGAELPASTELHASTETASGLQSFALWDISTAYRIDPAEFKSKGRATPFAGWEVYGKCLLNVVDGRIVWNGFDNC
jgi:dihydroorotase